MTLPENEPRVVLSTYLTQLEFKAVFGYYWVALNLPAYEAARLDYDERWSLLGRVGTGMLWSVRQLALKHKAKFTALQVDADGNVRITQPEPVCKANLLYVYRMQEGKGPNYLHLLRDAIRYMTEQGWEIDLEPMHEALAKVEADVAQAKADTDPEWEAEAVKTLGEAMKIAGYTKGRIRDRGHGGGPYEN